MNRTASPLDRWLFGALVALVALAPLPLGANRPLPAALIALAAGLLLLLWVFGVAMRGAPAAAFAPARRIAGPAALYLLVVVWIWVQWLPAPFASWGNPIWDEASAALGRELAPRITVDPAATLAALANLLAYGAIFWLAFRLTADPGRARLARNAVIAIGSAYAAFGLFDYFGGTALFVDLPAQRAMSSTFVNRNSFATFAGLALLCAATVWFERIRHILSTARPLRQKIVMAVETLLFHSGWATAALLAIAVALLLTASRGGILASLVALAAVVLLQLAPGRGQARRRGPVVLFFLAVVGVALLVAGNDVIERIDRQGLSIEDDLRGKIFATTIEAIRAAPWTGTGYGTYRDAIEAWRVNDPDIFAVWEKAHNTWLENAMELGLPAALALDAALFWLALIALKGVAERRRGRAFPALGVAATLLVGLHALVDFSLQIPAVAVLYAFIMGVAFAQSAPQRKLAAAVSTLPQEA